MISGVVVCWHFELLPRWALALLVAREALRARARAPALRRGVELKINWLGPRGRVADDERAVLRDVRRRTARRRSCLYVGLALVLGSAAQYVRDGLRRPAQASTSA